MNILQHVEKHLRFERQAETGSFADSPRESSKTREAAGFSLIETTFALLILLIALLGVFSVFTYAVIYNTANSTRSKALAVMQREAERIRAAKFTPDPVNGTDEILKCGEKTPRIESFIPGSDDSKFRVEITVDDDPATSGLCHATTKTLKEIKITVTPQSSSKTGWQAAVPAEIFVRRVRSN